MLYSIAFMHEDNGRGAVYRSWYTRGLPYRPYLVFRPGSWLRILLGMLATFTPIGRIGWTIAWWYVLRDAREEIVFVNDALDYTFFMDANVKEKNLAERLGFGQPVIQQTFVVPPDRTAAFLDEIPELMARERIAPTLIDILYMHEDRTTMSASHGREGFACTLSFEDIRDETRRARVIDALYELSERCHAHGGRVHLTKNVFARPDTLARMYGEQLTRFLEVKRALDPDGILQNRFFERVFSASAALL
jgi:FAD/FMN-containing dehydrogenase